MTTENLDLLMVACSKSMLACFNSMLACCASMLACFNSMIACYDSMLACYKSCSPRAPLQDTLTTSAITVKGTTRRPLTGSHAEAWAPLQSLSPLGFSTFACATR